jgi:hypothetical protein
VQSYKQKQVRQITEQFERQLNESSSALLHAQQLLDRNASKAETVELMSEQVCFRFFLVGVGLTHGYPAAGNQTCPGSGAGACCRGGKVPCRELVVQER